MRVAGASPSSHPEAHRWIRSVEAMANKRTIHTAAAQRDRQRKAAGTPLPTRVALASANGGYPCPKCGARTAVYNSRPSHGSVRRNRGCPSCLHRFTTYETIAGVGPELLHSVVDELGALVERYQTTLARLEAENG